MTSLFRPFKTGVAQLLKGSWQDETHVDICFGAHREREKEKEKVCVKNWGFR